MKAYIICSVRVATEETRKAAEELCAKLERSGWEVCLPFRDIQQDDPTGYGIVMAERKAIAECDRVFVLWDIESRGSHVDLGMAIMAGKPISLVKLWQEDTANKSYVKVIREIGERGYQ